MVNYYGEDDDLGARQEADAMMAQAEADARRLAKLRKAGVCTHGSCVGYRSPALCPEQEGLRPGEVRCTAGCGRVFESDDAWHKAFKAMLVR